MPAHECLARLTAIGITLGDAKTLRRIAMTLHHWYERECGDNWGCIERNESDGKTYWLDSHSMRRYPIPDRERGAEKRLHAIMARYPTLSFYLQTDPRGASLYILRLGDLPDGANVESYYSNGIAVYK